MKKKILFLLILLMPFVINAFEVKNEWEIVWGGVSTDVFNSVELTADEGYVAVGYSFSLDIDGIENKGKSDAIIVKYDKENNVVWQRNWGGNDNDSFSKVIATIDQCYMAIGYSDSTDIDEIQNKDSRVAIIVKYDKNGNILWQKSFGENNSASYNSIIETSNGDYVVVGDVYYNNENIIEGVGETEAIIIKYDKDGNELFKQSWGGNSDDYFESIFLIKDGYIVIGKTWSDDIKGATSAYSELVIIKFDENLNRIWQRVWGGNESETFESFIETSKGEYVIVGCSDSTDIKNIENKGDTDAILIKYDKDGNILWQKSFGGNGLDIFVTTQEIENEVLMIGGMSNSSDIDGLSNQNDLGGIIVKYDKDGNLLFKNSFSGNYKMGYSSYMFVDGGFIISGYGEPMDTLEYIGRDDAIIGKYVIDYDLETVEIENGTSIVEQQGKYGIVKPTPNEGYEVDKIVVKDKTGNVLNVEITKLEDGTYSFELYEDVSVEVLFKEKLVNPKTGVISYIGLLFSMLICSFLAFWFIMKKDNKYEL